MPAKPGQHRAESEHDHEQAADVDAERRHHRCIGRAGAHQHADPGVADKKIQHQRDAEARHDDDDPPHRIEQARHQHDRAGKHFRDRQRQRRGAPDEFDGLIEENDHAERRDDLIEMVAVVEMAENREFQRQPENKRGHERQHQRGEKAAGQRVEHHGEIGAQHVLDAMRKVDEVHHAEHERQPGRDQKQQHAELKAVERLNDQE